MKITRRQILFIIWAFTIIASGVLICRATGVAEVGWVTSLSLISISIGVPLMRAYTEFSK